MRTKLLLMSGASAFIFVAQAAYAQDGDATVLPSVEDEQTVDSYGDIIVTAQRRAQRLQDVPIAISAIGEEALENAGVTGTAQLQALAPGLKVNEQFGPASIYLRGIGFKSGDLLAESSVAVYVDGVYQANAVANVFEFNAVDRVEVLKGPQGTLFGRNATGGVVQVITKNPSFEPKMSFKAGIDNYETVSASSYVSGGLSDTLAANIALQYSDQNKGWGKNINTDEERFYSRDFNARGKLLFAPTDATEIILSGNYIDFNRQDVDPQNPPGARLSNKQGYLGRYRVAGDVNSEVIGKSYGGSLTATHDFGGFQIRNITAYQKGKTFQNIDQDAGPAPLVKGEFNFRSRMITEEFHVLSPASSKFQWLAGVYYYNFNGYSDPVNVTGLALDFPAFTDPTAGVSIIADFKARSISGFAQGTYPLTDKLNLTAGIRYTQDKVDYTGQMNAANAPVILQPQQTGKYKKSDPTWRLSLDYKFTPDILGYVSYNRGVKSGNYSLGTFPAVNEPFKPEKLDAYEAGLKTELLDRKLQLNLSGFYYDFKNIQFQRVVAGSVFTVNGPSAKLYGFEAEMRARVTPQLTLTANGGYLHSRLGDFPNAPNVNRLSDGRNDAGDPNYNAKGNRTVYAPKFSGNVGFTYSLPVDGGDLRLSSNLFYTSKVFTELDNRLAVDAHELLSASLTWKGDDGLNLSAWGTNLTNTYAYGSMVGVANGNDFAIPTAPRTYGVSVGYDF